MQPAQIIQFPQQQENTIQLTPSQLQEIIKSAVAQAIQENAPKRRKLTPEERQRKLSPVKSNGGKKATAALPIKDPKTIKAVRDYFMARGDVREYAIFSVGLTLGIRARDLLQLKLSDFMNPDGTFKKRLDVIEMKTDKRNKPLLTQYATDAMELYLLTRPGYTLDEPAFLSSWKNLDGTPKCYSLSRYNERLAEAGEAIGMHLSSHCMRHTFSLYMNLYAGSETQNNLDLMSLTITQMAMNHSDIKQTLAYTGLSQDMMDEKRRSLSDFLEKNT